MLFPSSFLFSLRLQALELCTTVRIKSFLRTTSFFVEPLLHAYLVPISPCYHTLKSLPIQVALHSPLTWPVCHCTPKRTQTRCTPASEPSPPVLRTVLQSLWPGPNHLTLATAIGGGGTRIDNARVAKTSISRAATTSKTHRTGTTKPRIRARLL